MVDIVKAAYQTMCKSVPGSYTAMAAMLNTSQSSLENRIYERKGQSVDVRMALEMQTNSGRDDFAHAVAEASGGVFIGLPPMADFDNEDIQAQFVALLDQMGKMAREWRTATEDGEVDKIERRRLEVLAQRIHTTVGKINTLTFAYYCLKDEASHE